MANTDAPFGLRPVKHLDGSPYNGAVNRYYVPSSDNTAIYLGDAVVLGGTADANGVPTAAAYASGGGNIIGVCVGVEPETAESTIYRVASTARYIYVADAPDLICEIQEDSVGGALAVTQVGNNFDIAVAAGSASTGMSAMELDSSDASGTATAQLRVIGLSQRPDNEVGVNAKWLVAINEHSFKSTTGV
jgi:hypothetical protein